MAATILGIPKIFLAITVLLASVQQSVAPPKAATPAEAAKPKVKTPKEKIQEMADWAYDEKKCSKYERTCKRNNLGSLRCVETVPKGAAEFSVDAVLLAQVLNPNTRSDSGDPTVLMIDKSFCKSGQNDEEYANRKFNKQRFIDYMTKEAHLIAGLIDNGGIIGNLIAWMGKQVDYSDFYKLPDAEQKLLEQDDAQAELMVRFIFDVETGRPEVPAWPACEEVKKVCTEANKAADQIINLVSLDCIKPENAKSVKITPQQLSAVGTQGGTRLGDLLCAQWPEQKVCINCNRATIKMEIKENMLNVRLALKNASVSGKVSAFTNDWMIKYLEPKRVGGGVRIGLGGGGFAPL